MKYSIAIISLGCSKNIIDSEIMTGSLHQQGYIFTEILDEADIIIVNTCGFIDSAKEESIDTIVEVGRYKTEGKCKVLIVSGCLAERYKDELMNELPEVDAVVGTGNINEISEVIEQIFNGNKVNATGNINNEYFEDIPRVTLNPSISSYIKIAEGCDNFCTYCIIPKLRGRYRSRKMEAIISEAKHLAKNGTKELILIAQDTGRYGFDLYGGFKLNELLDELNNIEGIKWIRILYLYPDAFTKDLIESVKRNDKVIKYIDMPIQHISDNVLKRMNRKTSKEDIIRLINTLRKEIPEIIIRTTLIVGFPGESEEEFNELYRFVESTKFDRLGVFTYSLEEGTPAAKMKDQINDDVKKERQARIMELQKKISYNKNSHRLHRVFKVLIEEEEEEGLYVGRTYMDSPEIDCIVYVNSQKDIEIGSFVDVKITDFLEYDLIGVVVDEHS